MPTGINSPGGAQRQNPLDYIIQGLQVAGAGLNIANDIRTLAKPSGPNELEIAKAGFKKKSPIAASAPDASAPASPLVAGAPATASAASPLAQVPAAPVERFSKKSEYKIGNDTYTRDDDEEKMRENEAKLRDKWTAHPVTKDSFAISSAVNKLNETIQNPGQLGPADMATIFSFMKLVDPGSTVREGEFANAENAGGVGTKFRNAWNAAMTGQRLTPELRKEFQRASQSLVKGQAKIQSVVDDQYKGLAKDEGFQESKIVVPLFKALDEQLSKTRSAAKEKPSQSQSTKQVVQPLQAMDRAAMLKELGL